MMRRGGKKERKTEKGREGGEGMRIGQG